VPTPIANAETGIIVMVRHFFLIQSHYYNLMQSNSVPTPIANAETGIIVMVCLFN
jgi:hypothetical protein